MIRESLKLMVNCKMPKLTKSVIRLVRTYWTDLWTDPNIEKLRFKILLLLFLFNTFFIPEDTNTNCENTRKTGT